MGGLIQSAPKSMQSLLRNHAMYSMNVVINQNIGSIKCISDCRLQVLRFLSFFYSSILVSIFLSFFYFFKFDVLTWRCR